MNKYQPAYVCPLCDTVIVMGEPREIPEEMLPELLAKVIRNQTFINNPALYEAPMHIPHKCKRGDAGLAVFAGFRKV